MRRSDAPEVVNEIVSNDDLQAPPGAEVRVRDYFGRRNQLLSGPQAFLVESFPAGSTTGAHFHDVDQFQVFFPAPGAWYQRTPIADVTVHYADAYTTYGPFGSVESDIAFFTLRREHSGITAYMPGSIGQLPRRRRRNRHGHVPRAAVGSSSTVAPSGLAAEASIIAPEPDGLCASLITAGGGARVDSSLVQGSAGQYFVILDGAIEYNGERIDHMAVGWRDPGSAVPLIYADEERGAEILVLQFPFQRPT